MPVMIQIEDVAKTFILHQQDSVRLPVFLDLNLVVRQGQCAVLAGSSGCGKSTLMRMVYGNYRCDRGYILLRHDDELIDVAGAKPQQVLHMRRRTMGYVSQFLRAIPRVPAIDVVAEPMIALGAERAEALSSAGRLLARLQIPERLWDLPPATFSGGEQQRVNIARGFIAPYPILLLDEPTASLDAANRTTVIELILEARERGAAILGIFHDQKVRDAVATSLFNVERFRVAA